MRARRTLVAFCPSASLVLGLAFTTAQAQFVVTNLVSNQLGGALLQDTNLVNAWGIAASGSSPIWSANNGTGTATVYKSTSPTNVTIQSLVVTVPTTTPITGEVFNSTASFNGDTFLFAAEDGSIHGWRTALGTTAETLVSPSSSSYKGLAIGNTGSNNYLYASNFATGGIDSFGSGPALAGTFTDPNLPAGYAPFNLQVIGTKLYATYAVRDPNTGDDVAGLGNGLIDVYDLNGNFQQRLVTGGLLNSPWGLSIAPTGFGTLAGDLLVGNFGDGFIHSYDPATGAFIQTLVDKSNNPIHIGGLWGLIPGNGGNGGALGAMYFTAGPDDESNGLFGSIAVPEPGTLILLALPLALIRRRTGSARDASSAR